MTILLAAIASLWAALIDKWERADRFVDRLNRQDKDT